MLIHVTDPLYETLCGHTERTGESFRLKLFDAPTSVENLAYQLFTEITELGFRLNRIEVRETDTSVVIYTRKTGSKTAAIRNDVSPWGEGQHRNYSDQPKTRQARL